MIRHLILGSVLALTTVHVMPAQRISIGIGREGVRVHGDFNRGPRPTLRHPARAGHWEIRQERIWVAGCERVEHVPARFAWRRDACGRRTRVCVRPAYDRIVSEPGRWQWQERRVWVAHSRRW